jgi:phage FluMu protein Com
MKKKPNYFVSLFTMKCPHCRRGDMFKNKNPFHWRLSHIFDMHEKCPVCKQVYELETGFWFGTGYVSYALGVAFSVFTLILYWLAFGLSFMDNSIFYWLGVNGVLLLLIQPWMMRISRAIYLYFFVYYDEDTAALPDAPAHATDHHTHA